jgi:hypothetical protein
MLKKPLTHKSILEAFSSLAVNQEAVQIDSDGSEAAVDGEWSQAELAQAFKRLGFASLNGGYAFVNGSETVGLVLQGVRIDPSANRFRTFSFEIQARSLLQARSKSSESSIRLI